MDNAPLTPLGACTPHAHPAYAPVVIMLAIVILSGGYFALASSQSWWPFRSNANGEPSPEVSWETHTNTQYGFEMQYPKGWSIVQDPSYYGGGVLRSSEHPFALVSGEEGETIADVKARIFYVIVNELGVRSMTISDYCLQICDLPKGDPLRVQSDQILATFQFLE